MRPLWVGTLLLIVVMTACSDQSRPSIEEWAPKWDTLTASVPSGAELGHPPSESVCQDTLRQLRIHSEGMLPTPDLATDDPVTDWIAVAEDAFFGCPPEGEISSFAEAYHELALLEEEVNGALDLE